MQHRQLGWGQPEAVKRAGTVRLDENVRFPQQPCHGGGGPGRAQVEVGVALPETGIDDQQLGIGQVRRGDVQYLRPVPGQAARDEGPGDDMSQVNDPDAAIRTRAVR